MATRTDDSLDLFFAAPRRLVLALTTLVAAVQGQEPVQTPLPAETSSATKEEAKGLPKPPQFRWVDGFGRRDNGKELGSTHGCLVIDSKGRLLANTDTEEAVLIFSPEGTVVGGWGKEYRGGLHGMTLRLEEEKEVLYLAHTSRHETLKTTIDGAVIWTLGWPESTGIYQKAEEFHPTAIVTSSDGRIFVADGYGKSWVHVYDKERVHRMSFGGPGTEPGRMQTPHGLFVDSRSGTELLLVCDRENHRLQWFTLDGAFVRESKDGLWRPCNVWPLADEMLAVADLAGRVTILDREDKPVLVLGDAAPADKRATNQIASDLWQKDVFFAPHSVCADAKGNLYVMDWNVHGRVSKLERVR
jgi:hypothetical protein